MNWRLTNKININKTKKNSSNSKELPACLAEQIEEAEWNSSKLKRLKGDKN